MNAVESVNNNLEKMTSNEEGGMLRLLSAESIGGNAGREGKYLCAGANFQYDNTTGDITIFTNYLRRYSGGYHGTFRLAVNLRITPEIEGMYRIIDIIAFQASDEALKVLKQSAEFYNSKYGKGFDCQELIIHT